MASHPSNKEHHHPSNKERQAARLYLEHDHLASTMRGASAAAATRHAEELDDKYPRVRDIALTGTARELGELPKHLRVHQLHERKLAGISNEDAAALRTRYRSGPDEEAHGTELEREGENPRPNRTGAARAAAGSAASAVDAGASSVYDSAADTDWGALIIEFFTWGAGLSVGFLLISQVKGTAKLFQGAANLTRAVVVSGVDPLNPRGVPINNPKHIAGQIVR